VVKRQFRTDIARVEQAPRVTERTSPSLARPVVAVQGLGFVGAAMATAIASVHGPDGTPRFDVVGVEIPTPPGRAKAAAVDSGRLPMAVADVRLAEALAAAHAAGNLRATTDERAYADASVTVVDVPVDLASDTGAAAVDFSGLRAAIRTLGRYMRPGSLILVETTVPPGTTDRVVAPELAQALAERGLPPDAVLLAHSYERVMPGDAYLESLVHYWRCYAGTTPEAADACERFLSEVIDVEDYPLTRLHSTTASETAKVLENSYRATTIALMQEWGNLAETAGVDLFEVVDAIRLRPTHSNMRLPGFGVGGYCLTKDPLFGAVASRQLFEAPEVAFPVSRQAVEINRAMPLASLDRLEEMLGGSVAGRAVLLMGVTYRPGVADTRYSASETFVREALARGAYVRCHDPLVMRWPELDLEVETGLTRPPGVDAIVFALGDPAYAGLDFEEWFAGERPAILDANGVLATAQRATLRGLGCHVASIGRGDGL
jgi:nucleotide sugar dehydrogenase